MARSDSERQEQDAGVGEGDERVDREHQPAANAATRPD